VPLRYEPASQPGEAAGVAFGHPGSRAALLEAYVDPNGARLVSVAHPGAAFGLIHQFHEALLLPGGRTITGWFAFGLLLLALLGIPLWWPAGHAWRDGRWRRAFAVSRRARGVRFWRELHIALGGWMVLGMLTMSVTGISLAWPNTTRMLFGMPPREGRPSAPHGPHGAHGRPALPPETGLNGALERLRAAEPDAHVASVDLGMAPAPFNLRFSVPSVPNQLVFGRIGRSPEGRDAALHMTRDPRRMSTGERVLLWMGTLHEAHPPLPGWAATGWRVLVALFGAALAAFSVTGFAAWLTRRLRRRVPPQLVARERDAVSS